MKRPPLLASEELREWLARHDAWRLEGGHLVRELTISSYPAGVRVVDAQVALAESLDHHPIITLGYRELRVELWTHDRGGLTQLDLDYAEGFDALLAGLETSPA